MSRGLSAAAVLALAVALVGASISSADPIADATYRGKVRGDGDKINIRVAPDGDSIVKLTLKFDNRCRQGGNDYTNANTAFVVYETPVKPTGKFKAKDDLGDSVAKGRFSANGKTARGKFTHDSRYDPGTIQPVECQASGRFKAKTKAKPPGGGGSVGGNVPLGLWEGETGEGLPVKFDVLERGLQELSFIAKIDCTYDNGTTFSDERAVVLPRADLTGDSFEAARGPDSIRGAFDGRTATGVVAVGSYVDEFEAATCAGRGEIPFTTRPAD